MKIVLVGGGSGGLYFSLLMKKTELRYGRIFQTTFADHVL